MYLFVLIKFTFALCFICCISTSSVLAAGSLTQGYHSDKPLTLGTVVSVTKEGGSDIEKTTTDNEERLAGVVVDAKDAIIDLQTKGTDVRVAINGDVNILASDLNGEVKAGDYLIASPLAGITMRDLSSGPNKKYVAIANQSFNLNSSGISKVSTELKDGTKKEVNIGLISAKLVLGDRPAPASENKSALNSLGENIVGKPVNNSQVFAASAVFITTFSLTGLLLHGSIRGSFISLGRNPLSQTSIVGSLVRVISLGIVILVTGVATSYVILLI